MLVCEPVAQPSHVLMAWGIGESPAGRAMSQASREPEKAVGECCCSQSEGHGQPPALMQFVLCIPKAAVGWN